MEENEKQIIGKRVDPEPASLKSVQHKANIVRILIIIFGAVLLTVGIIIFIFQYFKWR
ncbi:MAG: hypothetical protein MJ221_01475 [Bacilli bacterium]|nr:hypothetical protein [Bacilli bacterium]